MRLFLLTLLVAMLGCASQHTSDAGKSGLPSIQKYALVLLDRSGNPVAEGEIELPLPIPTGQSSFQGGWHLTSAIDSGLGILRSGKYAATIASGLYSFNLSPDVPDDSVHLSGLLIDDRIQGRWTHETLSGTRDMGQFAARLEGLHGQSKP